MVVQGFERLNLVVVVWIASATLLSCQSLPTEPKESAFFAIDLRTTYQEQRTLLLAGWAEWLGTLFIWEKIYR